MSALFPYLLNVSLAFFSAHFCMEAIFSLCVKSDFVLLTSLFSDVCVTCVCFSVACVMHICIGVAN